MLGFCSSPRFLGHDTGPGHPERPQRLCAIIEALKQCRLLPDTEGWAPMDVDFGPQPVFEQPLLAIEPVPADPYWIQQVHTAQHIDQVRQVCADGGVLDAGDTVVAPASFDCALLAAGGILRCCDAVLAGQVRAAFAAVRPPGHHAEPDRSLGFCLFSNAAIAARYLQRHAGLERIAIVDFDVHHCNGTQRVFDHDPTVMVVSLHEHPRICYPGTGYAWEIGSGPGRGYTLNVPFEAGAGDVEYIRVMDQRVIPELEEFQPQMLLISAGFDAHINDAMADMNVTEQGYELMTRSLAALAERHCAGRIVSILEGGYNLRALGRSVVHHLIGLGAR